MQPGTQINWPRTAFTVLLALYGAVLIHHYGTYGFMDSVDLPIHEAGHIIFSPFGEFIQFLGGTIMQVLVPAVFLGYFVVQSNRYAATVMMWWIAQNFWNISVYMRDARTQLLPLVGGGEHDWAYLGRDGRGTRPAGILRAPGPRHGSGHAVRRGRVPGLDARGADARPGGDLALPGRAAENSGPVRVRPGRPLSPGRNQRGRRGVLGVRRRAEAEPQALAPEPPRRRPLAAGSLTLPPATGYVAAADSYTETRTGDVSTGNGGDPVIELEHVVKKFGDFTAVKDLDLIIPKGVTYALLGPNGAGKTTTIRMILRIMEETSGSVRVFGQPVTQETLDRIGYLPEERGVYKRMTVRRLLAFMAEMKGVPARTSMPRIEHWLERLDLGEWIDAKVEELSKGMQQKLQFISSVLHDPPIVILDE
ncbi:MAG: ATP-binding cassette domain-containing protein, partial [Gemmatimonadota bacterium]